MTPQHQRAGDIETRKRFVQDEQLGIVHQGGDQHDTLAHAFGVGTDGHVAASVERKAVEHGGSLFAKRTAAKPAQRRYQLEILQAGQEAVQIGLLGTYPRRRLKALSL